MAVDTKWITEISESNDLLLDKSVVVESIDAIGITDDESLVARVKLDCRPNPVTVSWNLLKKNHPQVVIKFCEERIQFRDP